MQLRRCSFRLRFRSNQLREPSMELRSLPPNCGGCALKQPDLQGRFKVNNQAVRCKPEIRFLAIF